MIQEVLTLILPRGGGEGGHHPPPWVNPSQIFFRTNFFSWHLFDQTFFWEKNCVVNIFYLNLFTIIFNQKNLLRKFYQNFEEKIFVTKTLLTKNLFFTELAS